MNNLLGDPDNKNERQKAEDDDGSLFVSKNLSRSSKNVLFNWVNWPSKVSLWRGQILPREGRIHRAEVITNAERAHIVGRQIERGHGPRRRSMPAHPTRARSRSQRYGRA